MSTDTLTTQRRRRTRRVYAGYVVAATIFVLPVVFMLWSAFRASVDITSRPFDLLGPLTLNNFTSVFETHDFGRYILNSTIIAGASTLVGLLVGVPAAFVIVRRRWGHLGFVVLVARMAPLVIFLLPLFVLSVQVGAPSSTALNFVLLISAHTIITLPLCIWLTIPFMEAVPISIEEAAMIDGAGVLQRFGSIIVPLVAPGLAVATTLSFVLSWNQFIFALALSNTETIPLPVVAFDFIGEGQGDYGVLMAASSLISLPALVLSLVAQRWLVRGLTGGAVK